MEIIFLTLWLDQAKILYMSAQLAAVTRAELVSIFQVIKP